MGLISKIKDYFFWKNLERKRKKMLKRDDWWKYNKFTKEDHEFEEYKKRHKTFGS